MNDLETGQIFYGSATIYHEAKDEPSLGRVCASHVILNRSVIRKLSIKGVVYEPWQFSCYNKRKNPPISSYVKFIQCQKSFEKAFSQRLLGYTYFGADHYHADYMDPYPDWSFHPDMKLIGQVGVHVFYRWEG